MRSAFLCCLLRKAKQKRCRTLSKVPRHPMIRLGPQSVRHLFCLALSLSGWVWVVSPPITCGQERPSPPQEIPKVAEAKHIAAPPPAVNLVQIRQRPADTVVRLSLSARFTAAGKPRFVMGFRAVEEGEPVIIPFEAPGEFIKYFASGAELEINRLDALYQLDERQKSKLKFAAMGDMSRLVRELRELQQASAEISARDQTQMVNIITALAHLNRSLSEGVLREGSMFQMVLANVLSPDPTSANVLSKFSEQLEQWQLGLNHDQRKRLERLLLVQSQRLAEPDIPWEPSQTLALLASLDRSELENFLDPAQLKSIDHLRGVPSQLEFRND